MKNSLKVSGTLAGAGVTANNHLYLAEELKKQAGKTIPLYDEPPIELAEDGVPTGRMKERKQIGTVELIWDASGQELRFAGNVESEKAVKKITDGQGFALIANPESVETYRGLSVLLGLNINGAFLTAEPADKHAKTKLE